MQNSRRPAITGGILHGPGPASRTLAGFIFASRWLQAPLYLGLIVAQAIYVVLFFIELWHLIENVITAGHISETDVMLSVLALIDIVMIANLLIMVIIGGYETFVSKIRVNGHHDEPDWLSHVNANLLKVKLAISIISISSIHLLKTFIEVGRMEGGFLGGVVTDAEGRVVYSSAGVMWEVVIHLAFILSAIALAMIDRWSQHAQSGKQGRNLTYGPSQSAPSDDFVTVRLPAGSSLPAGAELVDSPRATAQ
ncbi:MAG: TIGR00645 family protein [Leucobacter sp.]